MAKHNIHRKRFDFSKIPATIQIPNLIEVQKRSYDRFLQMDKLPSEREDGGLQAVFQSVFPITDFRNVSQLARRKPARLYENLCRAKGQRQDICCLDVFSAAVAQARNPLLPAAQRQWWYWSRLRKARNAGR